VIEPHTLGNVA